MSDHDLTGAIGAACSRLGIEVPTESVPGLAAYAASLWSWNERLNLTRHTDPETFVARDVGDAAGTPVQVAYVGACTGAKLEDLRAAAQVLQGHRVAEGVQLMVAPASLRDQQDAEREGVMAVLRAAGAELLPTACGACSGYGGTIPEGANVIATTARNFKGRMGAATAQVYLASPYTVAASALRGRISDPREVLA